MEIVEYNERKSMLAVRYNTSIVWKYSPVDKEKYEEILNSDSPERLVKDTFHNTTVVGVVKEDI